MSLASQNFAKHGHTSFEVWLSNGQTTCAAFEEEDRVTIAFLQKDVWESMQWAPGKGNLLFGEHHMRVHDVRIVKSGWFASATVDFEVRRGSARTTLQGKTDKGFAEFLTSVVARINHE